MADAFLSDQAGNVRQSGHWLTIVGLGEDGAAGLSGAARKAVEQAECVFGASRHLALLPGLTARTVEWPVPFADGIAGLLAQRGRRVVLLASGDPFWFGAGTSVTRHLDRCEWRTIPALSTFSLAAARLGWALEDTACLGLHAAPFAHLRPHLAPGRRIIALLRDAAAPLALRQWLESARVAPVRLHVMEALGGPRERVRVIGPEDRLPDDLQHPLAVGIEVCIDQAPDRALPLCGGRPDALFANDGQITKRAVRALALSALAPRAGEMLWDIGAGCGSVAIEWLLAHPAMRAFAIENNAARAGRIRENAAALGVERLNVLEGRAPDILPHAGQGAPDAVFVGGGLSEALLQALTVRLSHGTRLVAHAVTLESETLLARWHALRGGELMRVELADAMPLGGKRGWRGRFPVVQWRAVL